MKSTLAIILIILSPLINNLTFAHSYDFGDFKIIKPHIRAVFGDKKVTAAYLEIDNKGEEDILISAKSDLSDIVQIHEIINENEISKMRKIENGLLVKSGKSTFLEPGGAHIMLFNLKQKIMVGDFHDIILNFKNAGSIKVQFRVWDLTKNKKHDHKHNH